MEFVVQQPATGPIWLEPLAVNYQLRNRPLSDLADDLGRGCRIGIHINLCICNPVGIEKLLRRPAIPAPGGSVNLDLHDLNSTLSVTIPL
jgi:hypothetical protein